MVSWRSYVREIQVGVLCIFVFTGSLFLLYRESKIRSGSQKEALGNVSFRYRTAQRKFPDRMLWEDLDQGMSVFDRDSVRTDEASEAVVFLNSGTQIELDPQSMVVLQLKENRETLELGEGTLFIQSRKILSVVSGKEDFEAKADSEFQISKSPDGFSLNVRKGEVAWREGGVSKTTVSEGEEALNGSKTNKNWILSLPEESYRFFPQENEQSVEFRWDGGTDGVWELSSTRDFHKTLESVPVSDRIYRRKFREGIYFWRIRSGDSQRTSEVRKFRVVSNPPPELSYPKKESMQEDRTVSFTWVKQKIASAYKLQISKESNFSDALESQVFRTNFSLTLEPGTYYWRVVSYTNLPGTDAFSEVRRFSVVGPVEPKSAKSVEISEVRPKVQETDSVSLEFPKNGSVVDMTGRESLLFRWKSKDSAKHPEWKFRLYVRKSGKEELVYERSVKGDRFSFRDLEKLDIGTFFWSVRSESDPTFGSEAEFKIQLRENLEAPETKASGARP